MTKGKDLTGVLYGRLTVSGVAGVSLSGHRMWTCLCLCGEVVVVRASHLVAGEKKSCGCLRQDNQHSLSHGHSKGGVSSTYSSWANMKTRCTNPSSQDWKDYGGRGITFDPAWASFEKFLADMGERPPGMTLDRKDNDGNYSKANCRWATQKEQARNSRTNRLITFGGKTQPMATWCEELGIPYDRTRTRLRRGWAPEIALR